MLAELGIWWVARMRELLAPLAAQLLPENTLLLRQIRAGSGEFEALRRRRGATQSLGQFPADRDAPLLAKLKDLGEAPVLLLDGTVLVRSITLPLAAEAGLATLLRYEMDRLTPFSIDDVFWSWRVVGRDRSTATMDVELMLLPRMSSAATLEALGTAGLPPHSIEAQLPNGSPCRLPVAAPDQAAAQRSRRYLRLSFAAAGILAIACLLTPLLRQSLALSEVETEMAALHDSVGEAQALQRRIAAANSGDEMLASAQSRASGALTALAALTHALPDDTFVTRLVMQQRRLTLEGQSKAATNLIAALSSEPHLQNPAFTAPVIRSENGQEIFGLRAEFAP